MLNRIVKRAKLYKALFPELELLPTDSDREEVLWKALKSGVYTRPSYLVLFGVLIAGGMPLLGRVLRPLWNDYPIAGLVEVLVVGLCLGISIPVGGVFLFRRSIRRSLREELAKVGIRVCSACAYCLRGLHIPRCPECGTMFDKELLASSSEDAEDEN